MSTVDERNAETSRQEVESFKVDEPGPYFAYHAPIRLSQVLAPHVGSRIVTWVGDDLARVTWAGEPFISNMGDRRQNFRALAINGATYTGTAYLSAGDYVRMRPVKG